MEIKNTTELTLVDKEGNSIEEYILSQESTKKVFGIRTSNKLLPKEVPVFQWKERNPNIPEIDENYKFEPDTLAKALLAIINNERCWISGETGTGKSTLVEQIAARLNYPLIRINFDSEITRSDLVGRDVLVADGGTTVSKFVLGALPQAISGPNITLFDEIDFIRPDVAYVLQSFLDGSHLRINEDGGKIIKEHKLCRVFATANSVGQGDLSARYAGARMQSCALRDRFGIWITKTYLNANQEINLLKNRGIDFKTSDCETCLKNYIVEHRRGFTKSDISIPLSPRSIKSAGNIFKKIIDSDMNELDALTKSLEMTVIDQCNPQDKSTLRGLMQRVINPEKTEKMLVKKVKKLASKVSSKKIPF